MRFDFLRSSIVVREFPHVMAHGELPFSVSDSLSLSLSSHSPLSPFLYPLPSLKYMACTVCDSGSLSVSATSDYIPVSARLALGECHYASFINILWPVFKQFGGCDRNEPRGRVRHERSEGVDGRKMLG